ncbi:MAG: aldehyde dehydrogenase family protein, partial [Usitatibacter sp.]
MAITSINPATNQAVKTYPEMTPAEVDAAIEQSHETWKSWRRTTFAERARLMKKSAAILRERKN